MQGRIQIQAFRWTNPLQRQRNFVEALLVGRGWMWWGEPSRVTWKGRWGSRDRFRGVEFKTDMHLECDDYKGHRIFLGKKTTPPPQEILDSPLVCVNWSSVSLIVICLSCVIIMPVYRWKLLDSAVVRHVFGKCGMLDLHFCRRSSFTKFLCFLEFRLLCFILWSVRTWIESSVISTASLCHRVCCISMRIIVFLSNASVAYIIHYTVRRWTSSARSLTWDHQPWTHCQITDGRRTCPSATSNARWRHFLFERMAYGPK